MPIAPFSVETFRSRRSYRDIVCEQDHSSVLVYLLGAPTEEVKNFRALMEQIQHSSQRLSRKYYNHQLTEELLKKLHGCGVSID